MLETYLRPWFQHYFVDKLAAGIAVFCSANVITSFSLVYGILCAVTLYFHLFYAAIACLMISGYLAVLNGTVARIREEDTPRGAIYGIVIGSAVEFLVVLGLFLVDPHTRAIDSLYMLGSIMVCTTSFLSIEMFIQSNTKKNVLYNHGLMDRTEIFLFFIAMIVWPYFFQELAGLFVVLILWTTIMRVYNFNFMYRQHNLSNTENPVKVIESKNSTQKMLDNL